jgi:hypothetical protein
MKWGNANIHLENLIPGIAFLFLIMLKWSQYNEGFLQASLPVEIT